MLFTACQSLGLYVPLHAPSKLGNTKQSYHFQIEMGREGERREDRELGATAVKILAFHIW